MESIAVLRRAVSELAARKLGRDARQPRQFTLQLNGAESMAVIAALPVNLDAWALLQNRSTGALLFVLDGDPLDSGPGIG